MIIEPWPEMMYLLFEASSQAKTSGGITFTSFCMYSRPCFTPSDCLIVMSPLAFTISAPKEANIEPTQSTESVVWPRPRPTGWPSFCSFCAAERSVSQLQFSDALVGALSVGRSEEHTSELQSRFGISNAV